MFVFLCASISVLVCSVNSAAVLCGCATVQTQASVYANTLTKASPRKTRCTRSAIKRSCSICARVYVKLSGHVHINTELHMREQIARSQQVGGRKTQRKCNRNARNIQRGIARKYAVTTECPTPSAHQTPSVRRVRPPDKPD